MPVNKWELNRTIAHYFGWKYENDEWIDPSGDASFIPPDYLKILHYLMPSLNDLFSDLDKYGFDAWLEELKQHYRNKGVKETALPSKCSEYFKHYFERGLYPDQVWEDQIAKLTSCIKVETIEC